MNAFVRSALLVGTGIAAGAAITISHSVLAEKTEAAQTLPLEDIQLFADVFGSIKNYYVDEVSDSKLIEYAIKGMVSELDPHSSYLDKKAFKDLEESTMGEFGGLGIEVTKDPQGVLVVSPIDDTPAARAGVLAGDIIVKLDGKSTADLSLNQNVKLMRGKPGTKIKLTIARKGTVKPLVIEITRAIIKVRSVKSKALANQLGYIRISQFQEHTWEDVASALQKLNASNNLKGLVLDLRNNPGGLLDAAIGVCAAFLPKGSLVVSTRGRDKDAEREFNAVYSDYNTGKSARDTISQLPAITKRVPIVVLVNTASASASEIVAGALQDHKRATIMGTKSFGKGSVQTIMPLRMKKGETTGIKITTARYYTPSGRTIQAKGITPDILVDDTPEGNYPSFNLRESDLANHIESEDTEKAKEKPMKEEQRSADEEAPESTPTLRYKFGEEKDFPLQQAIAKLLGNPVITHEDVAKAMKEKRAKEKAAKDKAAAEAKGADKP
jgi:carboxyl-terminal processing protease